MKKTLLAAGALLLATITAILYVWLETRDTRRSAAEIVEAARAASPDEPREDLTPTAQTSKSSDATPETAEANPPESGRTELETTPIDPLHSAWVEGSVVSPAGTPRDEVHEVLVWQGNMDAARRSLDLQESKLGAEEKLLGRAAVDANGNFRAMVPTDREHVYLALRSHYCFAAEVVEVGADPAAQRVSFTPKLGAWVTGRVQLPVGFERAEFEHGDLELEMMFDPMRFVGMAGGATAGFENLREREGGCEEDLSFEFRGLTPGSDYDLRLVPARLAAHKTPKVSVTPGAHIEFNVALTRGGTLNGRVLDDAQNGVADVEIEASIDPLVFGQGGFVVREAESGADGTFSLPAVVAGKVELKFEADGFLERKLEVEVIEGRATAMEPVVLSRGESVAGVVRWPDGTAAADLDVRADFDPAALGGMSAFNAFQGARGKTKSDAEGRFAIGGLGKGPFVVSAKAKAPGSDEESVARIAGVKPNSLELELTLEAPLSVRGRVVDASGAPVTKFAVTAREDVGGIVPGLGGRSETDRFTDEAGEFELSGLSIGKWKLEASADGFSPSAQVPCVLPLAEDAAPIQLVLTRAGSVSGLVFGLDGAPAPGVDVQVKVGLDGIMRNAASGRVGAPSTKSDAEGKFTLEDLSAGRVALVARAEGYAESEAASVEVLAEQETRDVVLRLRLGGTITGELYGNDGDPIAGGQILTQSSADPLNQRFATTDALGRFIVEHLAPGPWNVMYFPMSEMKAPEGDPTAADFSSMFGNMKMTGATVKDAETVHVVLGAPPSDPVTIKGQVHSDKHGLNGLVLTFIADGSNSLGGMKFTTTDATGHYSTVLDKPGRYALSVQKPGIAGQQQTVSLSVVVPEVETFEYDIAMPVGAITGRVLESDGSPAKGARVSLSMDGPVANGTLIGEHFAEISTDEDGRYELVWLKPGAYTVGVGGAPFGGMFGGSANSGRQVREGVNVREGARTENVDFKLKKPGRIEGLVRGSNGSAVAEAAIFLRDGSGRTLERFSMVTTDGSGRFSYDGLEPGEYTVLARTASDVSGEGRPARVKEGQTAEIELSLSAGTILIVSLSGDDGEPIDCSVTVLDEAGRQVNGTMSFAEIMQAFSSGQFSSKEQRVGPLPPGKYRVTVSTSDGRKITKPVTLTGQPERKLNVKL